MSNLLRGFNSEGYFACYCSKHMLRDKNIRNDMTADQSAPSNTILDGQNNRVSTGPVHTSLISVDVPFMSGKTTTKKNCARDCYQSILKICERFCKFSL